MEMGSFCRPKMQNAKKTWKRVSSYKPWNGKHNSIEPGTLRLPGTNSTQLWKAWCISKEKRSPKDVYVLTHSKHVVNVVMLSAINFFTEPILSIFFPQCLLVWYAWEGLYSSIMLERKRKWYDLRNSSWFIAADKSWRIGEASQHFPKTRKLKKSERGEKIPKFPLFF